ncbi:MAG: phosphatase PAP2 family protein [Candidatus Micrarchaeota archaeon]
MHDAITRLVTSIHIDALTQIDIVLDNPFFYLIILLGLLIFFERRDEKRLKILFAMVLAFMMGIIVNIGMAVERPCAEMDGAICPMLYSFPSIHCTMAFILMISFLNKKPFPYLMLFALFIAFSRLHLGVHVFRDVAGGLIVGLLAYNIADIVWRGWKNG